MTAIDRLTGEFIDAVHPALFSYLSGAYRMGHLFIEIEGQSISPYIEELFLECDSTQEELVRQFQELITSQSKSDYFHLEGSRLFLRRAYSIQESIAQHLDRIRLAKPRLQIDLDRAEKAVSSESLELEQKNAIMHALKEPIAAIWGGPGTGKTYTAARFLKTLLSGVEHKVRVMLCAPTGKAVSAIARSIQMGIGAGFEAKTLHSLLQIRPLSHKTDGRDFLPYDLFIVDESSMIDAALFQKFICRVASGAKIVFLGDPDQLAPVEPGAPFLDLVAHTTQGRLIRCLRAELAGLVHFSALVRDGKVDEAIAFADASQGVDLHLVEEERLEDSVRMAMEELSATVLSPLCVGPLGTDALNEQLKKRHCAPQMPIIMLQNDHDLGLVNGQIGSLRDDMAYFETPEGKRAIPRVLLGPFSPAFCLSVHKSQGSEFDEVLLVLPPGSERFGRKMLYTAITRAKKRVTILSTEATFRACIEERAATF